MSASSQGRGVAPGVTSLPGRWLLAIWRLSRVVGHISMGLLLVYSVMPREDLQKRQARVGRWSSTLLRILGVELHCHGQPMVGHGKLVIANHISWLDIMVINAVMPCRFVSKAEIAKWPIVGRLVSAAGTLYLVREKRKDALRVLGLMAQALARGDSVAVFPEGTTGMGEDLMHFHPNLMQAAIDAKATVQPVVLHYEDAHHRVSQAVPYVGDMDLVTSLWRIASANRLTVHVTVLDPRQVHSDDRRELTATLHDEMSAALRKRLT